MINKLTIFKKNESAAVLEMKQLLQSTLFEFCCVVDGLLRIIFAKCSLFCLYHSSRCVGLSVFEEVHSCYETLWVKN